MMDMQKRFHVKDGFLGHYENLVIETVLPYQEKVLKDEIEGVEKSHAIENFRGAAQFLKTGKCDEEFYGMVFQDSDVAKWLEAAAYSMESRPDRELEQRCDAVIELIGSAQHKNGYLNTYFTVKQPGGAWQDLCEGHELYCAGHMMEAAVAYAQSTGKKKLLSIMERMADHIYEHFIVEKAEGYPGHPEVELALMRMYHFTGNEKYLELAKHFIDVRGVDSGFFERECENRGWDVFHADGKNAEYAQNHKPVREQTKAAGHAVRAVYLYTGMAALGLETKDTTLIDACRTLWNNINDSQMYITGAIGATYEGEAFTKDYNLPNDTAYGETCASVGLIFFSRKMLDIEKKGKYADMMERALYNCVLAGMQLDGKRFFYVNPLEVIPGISGEVSTHGHVLPQRPEWFACACCPPNVARLLVSLPEYAWSVEENTVYSHLYIGGELDVSREAGGRIQVETGALVDGKVLYQFIPSEDVMEMTLAIRIPFWSKQTQIEWNGNAMDYEMNDGYVYLTKEFTNKDRLAVSFDMSIHKVYASSKVAADSGKVCLMRGPVVYCAEGVDQEGDVLGLQLKKDAKPVVVPGEDFVGIPCLEAEGYHIEPQESLYSFEEPKRHSCKIRLIPYFAWGNRGLNEMRVWLPETE